MPNLNELSPSEYISAVEKEEVQSLGTEMGFGRMMQLAQECWRESLVAQGHPSGGEFAYGPCVAMTVQCGCRLEGKSACDWCEGSGWLTKKVKAAQDEATGRGEPLTPVTREAPMVVRYGEGKTEFGPGVTIDLPGSDVATAIDAWLVAHNVYIHGPRTILVNDELCRVGRIYVDPSGQVIVNGQRYSGRGPEKT